MLRVAVIASLGVAGAAVIAPREANAAYVCGQNQVCIYAGLNETGSVAVESRLQPGGPGIMNFQNSHFTNGQNLNDAAQSVVNNTVGYLSLCSNLDLTGTCTIVFPHTTENLTTVTAENGGFLPVGFIDVASSAINQS